MTKYFNSFYIGEKITMTICLRIKASNGTLGSFHLKSYPEAIGRRYTCKYIANNKEAPWRRGHAMYDRPLFFDWIMLEVYFLFC